MHKSFVSQQALSQPVHETATYRCDDTRGCVIQFWAPDDEHMCSKHVEAWDKRTVKQKFCASSLLITEINVLRCRERLSLCCDLYPPCCDLQLPSCVLYPQDFDAYPPCCDTHKDISLNTLVIEGYMQISTRIFSKLFFFAR